MSAYLSVLVLCLVFMTGCTNKYEESAFRNSTPSAEATFSQEFFGAKDETKKYISKIASRGKPRVVQRGAKPEIIIKGSQIIIDGKLVSMGQPVEVWKAVLPGSSRCDNDPKYGVCDWDELGVTIILEERLVKTFELYLNKDPWWPTIDQLPDGTPFKTPPDLRPKNNFRGYFEWDGYGIDADTKFWEIRDSVHVERNVRCDFLTNNCGNTTAYFNDNYKIYLSLIRSTSEKGRLSTFAISR